jgi:hypothetical protein
MGLTIGEMAKVYAESGMFGKALTWQQAVVKIGIGRELGLGPVQAIQSVDVFDGNISLRSNLRAACIKMRKGYDYRVEVWTPAECSINFLRNGTSVGIYTYTMEDAKLAGLAGKNNWRTHPKAMLFARAMSAGQRAYMPEVMMGLTVYDPDEADEIARVHPEGASDRPASLLDKVRQRAEAVTVTEAAETYAEEVPTHEPSGAPGELPFDPGDEEDPFA